MAKLPTTVEYGQTVLAARRQKDDLFRTGADSPVPAAEREIFPPLDYYPVDPSWRLSLPMIPDRNPEILILVTNMGEKRRLSRVGHVAFVREGAAQRLAVYRILDDPTPANAVFIPFTDAGSGKETYPGGRYLDTFVSPDGTVSLDFNVAYNPYCAYGWAYSCPIAPSENRLAIAVRAGEKGFHHP